MKSKVKDPKQFQEKDGKSSKSKEEESLLEMQRLVAQCNGVFESLIPLCERLLEMLPRGGHESALKDIVRDIKRVVEDGKFKSRGAVGNAQDGKNGADVKMPTLFNQGPLPVIKSISKSLKKNRTILLAEDEDELRHILRTVLEENGFIVLTAKNVFEVLSIYNQQKNYIDLILTDVMMPEMSGPELGKQARILREGMKVIFMSGLSRESLFEKTELVEKLVWDFIQKPFTPQSLIEKVKKALE